ncbi:chorismate-binding protein, partial [Leucobacter sp. M11]|uniref:chorismate-binding protein n=1 Tax=Leucobacter sp. M11 TaxID=2993565 RepID=UPI002D7EF5B0
MSPTAPHPVLRVVTRALDSRPDLVALADPANPLLWVRGDRGCVGLGELLRLSFRGPSRFADAGAAWRELAAAARVTDPVGRPGSGLIALGAFAFSDASAAESVLIIPRRLVARDGDQSWVTDFALAGDDTAAEGPVTEQPAAALAEPRPLGVLPDAPGFRPGAFDEAGYREAVARTTRRIADGVVEKVVLARDLVGELPAGSDLRVPLGQLARGYVDCWTFAVDGILGASPETLIRSTSGAVSARVLA